MTLIIIVKNMDLIQICQFTLVMALNELKLKIKKCTC